MDDAEGQEPERDPETLELFIEETVEALQRMERLLIDAEEGHPAPDILTVLFRDFHTIKGTSGFLALSRILGVSHAAEDLLAELRELGIPPNRTEVAVLVRVVDVIRRMIDTLRASNSEGNVDVKDLVAELHTLRDAPRGPAGTAAAAPTASPPPAAAHATLAPAPASTLQPAPATTLTPVHALPSFIAPAGPPAGVMSVVPSPALTAPPQAAPPQPAQPQHAQAPAPAEAPQAESRGESVDGGTVRVSVHVLDRLMNLIGELVLARNQMVQVVKGGLDGSTATATLQRLSLVTTELQEQVMKTRMQPVARVFERIPRMIRDLSAATGKQVATQIEGNATEIDRALVEAIRDPVMHIVRNAVDHGVESRADREVSGKPAVATLTVRAVHEGGMVLIEIGDDGRGIDPKKIRDIAVKRGVVTATEAARLSDRDAQALVFRPGFSTAEQVTDISGRGVGMDVVRSHVERAGGQVDLDSIPGVGTTIRLKMPLTLAIIPALLVRAGGQRFAIPQVNLLELVHLNEEQQRLQVENVRGSPIYRLRGEVLPLVRLATTLKLEDKGDPTGGTNIVVVGVGDQRYGLVVDEIHDTEEIVVKPLHGVLKRLPSYSGATVLGDGNVALIIEVAGVAAMAGVDSGSRQRKSDDANARDIAAQPHIVFEAGEGVRFAVPLAMVARLEVIAATKIERVGREEVLQYRGAVIPVIRPEAVLPIGTAPPADEQVLLVFEFVDVVAIAVHKIIDIVDVVPEHGNADLQRFVLGQQVIFGRTTQRLDVYGIVQTLAPAAVRPRKKQTTVQRSRVLIIDDSSSMRTSLADYLRSSGVEVVDVPSAQAALKALRNSRESFQAVVADLELDGMSGYELISVLRRDHPNMPIVAWTGGEVDAAAPRVMAAGGERCFSKLDRNGLCDYLRERGVQFSKPLGARAGEVYA